jgi:hypothetical protein
LQRQLQHRLADGGPFRHCSVTELHGRPARLAPKDSVVTDGNVGHHLHVEF